MTTSLNVPPVCVVTVRDRVTQSNGGKYDAELVLGIAPTTGFVFQLGRGLPGSDLDGAVARVIGTQRRSRRTPDARELG